jgi:hypothetical protein
MSAEFLPMVTVSRGLRSRPVGHDARLDRLMGTFVLYEIFGADAWPNARTAGRRRSDLRRVGITPTSAADAGIDLTELLRTAIECWSEEPKAGPA